MSTSKISKISKINNNNNMTYSTISKDIIGLMNHNIKLLASYDYHKLINILSPLQINLLISNLLQNIDNNKQT